MCVVSNLDPRFLTDEERRVWYIFTPMAAGYVKFGVTYWDLDSRLSIAA